MNPRPI